jgi:hypothetical protein
MSQNSKLFSGTHHPVNIHHIDTQLAKGVKAEVQAHTTAEQQLGGHQGLHISHVTFQICIYISSIQYQPIGCWI